MLFPMGPVDRLSRTCTVLALTGVALIALACRGGPGKRVPFRPPEVTAKVEHFAGSTVSGPISTEMAAPPGRWRATHG